MKPDSGKQSHTARYQGSEATIHYPFHPRSGERVEIPGLVPRAHRPSPAARRSVSRP